MKYIEVCKSINDRNNFVLAGTIKPEPRNHELYVSLFPFDHTVIEYVKANGTIRGHQGNHYCDYILFDIDCENDQELSRISAIELILKLNREYGINPDELFIWFSGNKGFHIAIVSKTFGQIDPSNEIAKQIKRFVEGNFSDIQFLDSKIYENHRIIRVENSLHEKSKLYKIQISFDELKSSILEIRRLAKEPRNFKRSVLYSDIQFNEQISRDIKTNQSFEKEQIQHEEGFFLPSGKGNRNNQLFKQACMLFNTSDLYFKSIHEIIKSINLASNDPIPEHEVYQIINSASAKTVRKKEHEELRLKTVIELIPEWIDYISKERKQISMLFDSLNKEFKGKLRGKLGIMIGYGGSKKSLLGQNIAFDNAFNYQNTTIYSNMEMSNAELISRFIDIAIDGSYTIPSYELEMMYHDGKNIEPILKQSIYEVLKNNILVSDNSNMTSEKYRTLILKCGVKPDILIVDGLSMMGGSGTELELANKHSKELKELAKSEDIFILAIVHASKGENFETRDLTRKARASEKIMDNCDFAITTSLIKDSTDPNNYEERTGYYHCWNKRGTGKRIERQFEFGLKNLRILEKAYSDNVPSHEGL